MRILAVDDDVFILELLPVVLSDFGYDDVAVTTSAQQALSMIESDDRGFDCLFLDIHMSGMDGIELCRAFARVSNHWAISSKPSSRAVRAMPGYKTTPIVMLTSMTDKAHIDWAFAAGATDYVTKPFDVTELGARVRVAEKLHAAHNAALETPAEEPVEPVEAGMGGKPGFDAAQRLEEVEGTVESEALANYLGQLSKARLYNSNIFAIKIDQAEVIHAQTGHSEYYEVLKAVGGAIGDALGRRGFFLMSYTGGGVFVCIFQSEQTESRDALERDVQDAIEQRAPDLHGAVAAPITVSAGEPLKPHISSAKRSARIFRVAIARAEGKHEEKAALLQDQAFRRVI